MNTIRGIPRGVLVKLALASAGLVWSVALLFWGQLTGALFVAGASVFLGLNDGWRLIRNRGKWRPMQVDEGHVPVAGLGLIGIGFLVFACYLAIVSRPINALSFLSSAGAGICFIYVAIGYFREHPLRRRPD